MFRLLTGSLLALLLCALPLRAVSAALTLETAPPAGFDELTEPQRLLVDVYFGGHLVGTADATVDPYRLRFTDPRALLEQLPSTTDPEAVLELLAQPQPLNAHRVCRNRQQRRCGFIPAENLAREPFALIYDESRFRADLFFAPELLPQKAALEDPYLPRSSSGLSFMQNFSGSWSGVQGGSSDARSASLFGRSLLSVGEHSLQGNWSASDSGDAQLYQLHWSRDYRGRAWSAGLIQPRAGFGSFVSTPYLYGLEYRSSDNSRTDRRYTQGSPLEVHMPVRGRVEVHRDNRLLHSQLLEAGNQLLDTSPLPGGSYEVEIRTFDESGRPLERYREFFTKDARLPAPGEWQWALQLGRPAYQDQDQWRPRQLRNTFLQAGVARRLLGNTGLHANLAATENEQLLELGARWVGEYFQASPSLIRGADGRSGYRLNALLRSRFASLSISETRLQGPAPSETGYQLLGRSQRLRNVSLSAPLAGGQLALRHSERERQQLFDSPDFILDERYTSANRLTTLEYRRTLLNNRHWGGVLTLRHSRAGDQAITTANVEFRLRRGDWNHRARLRADSGDADQNTRLGFHSNWNARDRWALDLNQQFSGETAGDDYNLASRTRINGRRGQLGATLNYSGTPQQSNLNYLGNFNTSLTGTAEGLAWGGERNLDSAVMVEIEGGEDEDFEILVDGVRRGYARGGARSLVNLPAFRSYEIQLRPLGDGFYDYRETRETITLYPGNVASTGYAVETQILVLGRLLHNGEPLTGETVTIGDARAVSNEYGIFQLEIEGAPDRLQLAQCRLPLPSPQDGEHWVNLGDVEVADCD